jgi:hypothetical protein
MSSNNHLVLMNITIRKLNETDHKPRNGRKIIKLLINIDNEPATKSFGHLNPTDMNSQSRYNSLIYTYIVMRANGSEFCFNGLAYC